MSMIAGYIAFGYTFYIAQVYGAGVASIVFIVAVSATLKLLLGKKNETARSQKGRGIAV